MRTSRGRLLRILAEECGGTGRAPAVAAAGVGAVATGLYALTACPTVWFGDSGELIAAASCLGVAHPPGYPLYTLLGWLALSIPLGEPALRMNLLSALFGGGACGVLAWLARRLTGSAVAAVAAGLSFAASSTFWSVATVAEVYTLHVLLVVLLLSAARAAGDGPSPAARGRALVAAAAALGLGLAHHPTIVLALPAAAVLALAPGDGGTERSWAWRLPAAGVGWWIAAGAVAVALPALLAASLVLRSRLDPPSDWGRPSGLSPLLAHVTAAAYRHLDLGWRGLFRGEGWARITGALAAEFGAPALILAAIGLAGRPRAVRAAAALLVLAAVAFGLRYQTDDVEVFLLPAVLGVALAASFGTAALLRHRLRAARLAGWAGAVLLVAVPATVHLPARNLRNVEAAADYGRDVLATVPRSGVLFAEVDDSFPLAYLHQVLGERSDVTLYGRSGTLHRDLLRESALSRRPGESHQDLRIRSEQEFIDAELAREPRREIYFLGWPGYDVPARYRLEPVGLLYRVCRASDTVRDDRQVWASYHEREVREAALRAGGGVPLAFAATYVVARGERDLFEGDRAAAFSRFEEASRLAQGVSSIQSYIGTVYGRIGEYARAVGAFRRALDAKPGNVAAWNNLAMACERAGDAKGARSAWERSLALIPGQTEALAGIERLRGAGTRR